jgi:flavin-dependent dehydrogenase
MRVTAGTATYHARSVILACGASYGLQRQLGLGLPQLFLHSAQAELPADCLGDVEVFFGSQVAPRGFAWAVPVLRADRPHVRVGVMCHGNAAERFHGLVDRLRPLAYSS